MLKFKRLFTKVPSVIGMVHVDPLPGTPRYVSGSWNEVVKKAQREAEIYLQAGVDGVLVENMHDTPYLNRGVGAEVVASMTSLVHSPKLFYLKNIERVRESVGANIPCGLQILSGCNQEALAVAKATGTHFIRAEGFVFSHIADEGIMNSDAGTLLRYRKAIDADDVMVFADIKKKHSSHSITSDVSLTETADAVEFFLGDGVVLTGSATGATASQSELEQLLTSTQLPVLVGSGVTVKNFGQYKSAHGIIVGSHFKHGGVWKNEIDFERVNNFMNVVRKER